MNARRGEARVATSCFAASPPGCCRSPPLSHVPRARSLQGARQRHGGGRVAVNREVMGQSITPFVRAGFTVYSIDYPLAPECRFPGPLISVIRACSWIQRHSGSDLITVVGDSAGGNLTTMCAAMLSNPFMLERLERCAFALGTPIYETVPLAEWSLPSVSRVVSMYGVVDQMAWRAPCPVEEDSLIMQLLWEGTSKVLSFCFDCYAPLPLVNVSNDLHAAATASELNPATQQFLKYLTLGDLLENELIEQYPPTLLICGSGDPLVLANRKVRDLLEKKIIQKSTSRNRRRGGGGGGSSSSIDARCCCSYVNLLEFPGPHAFHGIPPQWTLDGWRSNSYPTTREMLLFLTNGEIELPLGTIQQPNDWSLPLVLLGHGVIVVGLLTQAIELVLDW